MFTSLRQLNQIFLVLGKIALYLEFDLLKGSTYAKLSVVKPVNSKSY